VTQARVRDARGEDAAAIASIHVRGWRHAYPGLVPDELLASLDVVQKRTLWEGVLAGNGPDRGATLVSVDDEGDVMGFAQVGASQGDDADLAVLYGLYLEPAAIGTGVGRVLLAEATERMRAAGFTRACLDVLPGNERARHVYEAAGWRPEGEPYIVTHGSHELPHQRYVREL
jgi:GNAT superfamily N-acetyltransferase